MHDHTPVPDATLSWLQKRTRSGIVALLGRLKTGRLRLEEGDHFLSFGPGHDPLAATIRVLNPRFYPLVGLRGSLGAAEAYMEGYWSTNNLTALIQVFLRNRDLFRGVDSGWARLMPPLLTVVHFLKANTRRGSRRNISAHYDLGNDFFQLFLDPTLMYSCALFPDPQATLEEASRAKMEHVCRRLQLRPEDHLVEIGTGWGGLAIYAASRFGCRVTSTTISKEQVRYARKRVAAAGLEDLVTVVRTDYRDLKGEYDKLVSIEMIEAVGSRYLPTYFQCCHDLLRPGGQALIQAITTSEATQDKARFFPDFIKHYIFPGSHIPSMVTLNRLVESTGWRLEYLEEITSHYPRTLRHWCRRFLQNREKVRRQGFSDEFIRKWEFYFCYCEAGFLEGHIGDFQILLRRPLPQGLGQVPTHGAPLPAG